MDIFFVKVVYSTKIERERYIYIYIYITHVLFYSVKGCFLFYGAKTTHSVGADDIDFTYALSKLLLGLAD